MAVTAVQGPVARDEELEAVRRLALFGDGPRALLLEGEAGIGKTTLWRAGVEAARGAGVAVREVAAAESEASFAYAGLGDLLRHLPAAALAALPTPQRRALEGALLVREVEEELQPHAVAAGCLGVLRALAAERPLLVAVDDVQWLDAASADALAFAARRLGDAPVRLLLTSRPRGGRPLERAADARRLVLDRLSMGALQHLLLARGLAVSARVVRRVHEASGGNPLFALELTRAVATQGGELGRLGELPVPETLAGLLDRRVAGLSPVGERALLAAALLADPTVSAVAAAAGGEAGIEAAEDAGLLVREQGRLRLAHPLLGTAARGRAAAPELRRLHRRLAELVDSDEQRGRHLALAAEAPDEQVAEALDRAAVEARNRGARASAAELAREAVLFTDPADGERRRRRLLTAADAQLRAGLLTEGQALLEPELASFPAGPERARARAQLLVLSAHDRDLAAWEAALAEAEGLGRAEILAQMAFAAAAGVVERLAEARAWAEEAVELAAAGGSRPLQVAALQSLALVGALQADPAVVPDLELRDTVTHVMDHPARVAALAALRRGDLAEAGRLFDELLRLARRLGEEWSITTMLLHRVELAARVGDRGRLVRAVRELDPAAAPYGALLGDVVARVHALLAALDGDPDVARRLVGQPARLDWQSLDGLRAIGTAALFAGDATAAAAELTVVHERVRDAGVRDPGAFPVGGDLAEALVAAGRLDEAEAVVEELAAAAREQGHAWAAAVGARARGLLLAARGDPDGAEAALREAAARSAAQGLDLDEARSLLELGALLRRGRRLREAREALEQAADRLERLGVAPLAARARNELARVAGRRSAQGLTPTEQRVAELAIDGLSNREIARTLVVTLKVVERHLTRIYRKLGVRDRRGLAGAVGESGGSTRLPD